MPSLTITLRDGAEKPIDAAAGLSLMEAIRDAVAPAKHARAHWCRPSTWRQTAEPTFQAKHLQHRRKLGRRLAELQVNAPAADPHLRQRRGRYAIISSQWPRTTSAVLEPVPLAGIFGRAWDAVRLWIR